MGDEKSLPYAVILPTAAHFQAAPIAKALAKFGKIPVADAAAAARRCWGIVAENLEKEAAASLSDRLEESGLKGLCLPQSLLEEPPPSRPAAQMDLGKEKLHVVLKSGEELWCDWSSALLIAAAGFKKTTTKMVKIKEDPSLAEKAVNVGLLMAGLPIKVGPKNRETVKAREESDLVFYLDLCLGSPAARLRVDGQDFNYSCLGPRMTYNVLGNFKTLVGELAAQMPQAWRNRGALVLLENKPISAMGYEGLEDLEKENRWLLTLRALAR